MGKYRVLDLFCGTGGFSKGFVQQGSFNVICGIDVQAVAVRTFRLNHPGALAIGGEIRSFSPATVADCLNLGRGQVEVVIGGPPCQGFSSIRPHRSSATDDHRNVLFLEFVAYVEHFRPGAFVLENVVGLATHREGRTIETMQASFQALGYETDWRIINAAHNGVSQKRERLILLGVERGLPLSFPPPTHWCNLATIGHRDKRRMLVPDLFTVGLAPLQPAVTVVDAIDDLPPIGSGEQATTYGQTPRTAYQAARRGHGQVLTLHASTAHTPRMLEIVRHAGANISHIPSHLISSGFSSCYSRLAANEPAVTITVNFVHPASNRCIHPTLDRALTAREGARLQSFDDDFRFAGTRTHIVKQIGNAVPPLLGQALGSHVARLLSGEPAIPETALALA